MLSKVSSSEWSGKNMLFHSKVFRDLQREGLCILFWRTELVEVVQCIECEVAWQQSCGSLYTCTAHVVDVFFAVTRCQAKGTLKAVIEKIKAVSSYPSTFTLSQMRKHVFRLSFNFYTQNKNKALHKPNEYLFFFFLPKYTKYRFHVRI